MKILKTIAIMGALIMFNGCSTASLDYYAQTSPKADIKDYFNGPIKAWGIVQDWQGKVVNRFDVDIAHR